MGAADGGPWKAVEKGTFLQPRMVPARSAEGRAGQTRVRAVPGTSLPRAGGSILAPEGCGEGGRTGEAGGEWFPLHTIFKHKGVFLKLKSGCVFLTPPIPR